MLKKLYYASASVLMLAFAFYLGVLSANARNGGHDTTTKSRIVTKELVVVDERGETRAVLGISNDQPFLALKDTTGTLRASLLLSSGDGSPYFGMHDADGTIRALLAAAQGAALTLSDSKGTDRILVAVTSADAPVVAMYDSSGAVTWAR